MLIDSHCHLDHEKILPDLPEVLARAEAAGVERFLGIFTEESGLEAAYQSFQNIRTYSDRVYGAIGVHPHEAKHYPDLQVGQLSAFADDPHIVALGECGLDYHYDFSPPEVQKYVFRQHIKAAQQTGLPLVIHTREAEEDTLAILREGLEEGAFNAVLHCFTSSLAMAQAALEMGFHLSFTGVITFKNSEAIREVVAATPLDRLMVETDSPYMAPAPHRGQTCEPAHVRLVVEKVAEVKNVDVADVIQQTGQNFFKLFAKAS